MDLILTVFASLLILPFIFLFGSPVQVILGLFFALFFPGYILLAAIFSRRADIDTTQRLVLSFALSIAIVPLIGLILNYSPWGIRLYPVTFSLLAFILITAGISWYRRMRTPIEERYQPRFSHLGSLWRIWNQKALVDRILIVILILTVIAAGSLLGYWVKVPKNNESFTEFYLLGPEGKAENYPRDIILGNSVSVTMGISNHENREVQYYVDIACDNKTVQKIGPISLSDEEKWEERVAFIPSNAGKNQKVEFLLSKDSVKEASQELHFWINVVKP